MQPVYFTIALAGLVLAAPAPAPEPTAKPALEDRQLLGGSGGGVVGSIGGEISGLISGSVLAGCVGGYVSGKGTTLCKTITVHSPEHTSVAAPHAQEAEVEERQIAGSIGGFVGSSFISGTLTGAVAPTLTGCIGGAIPFGSETICLGLPAKATPTKH